MKIIIKMDLDAEFTDPDHEMGVTEDGYMQINDRLGDMGTDIEVSQAEPS